jgi:hypothetical protein
VPRLSIDIKSEHTGDSRRFQNKIVEQSNTLEIVLLAKAKGDRYLDLKCEPKNIEEDMKDSGAKMETPIERR